MSEATSGFSDFLWSAFRGAHADNVLIICLDAAHCS
jgi:hypothetical protein